MSGLAFSGGGIRSVALCSGVLRRLLKRGAEPDYLSCVSGGGYTGTAYLDWKWHKSRESNKSKNDETNESAEGWHDDFFNQMRKHSGYICNFQEYTSAFCDPIVFALLVVFVNICIPGIIWCSFAFTSALANDVAFGNIINAARFRCKHSAKGCQFPEDSLAFDRMLLFSITSGCFVSLHVILVCINKSKYSGKLNCVQAVLNFLKTVAGLVFALTFLPWFINDYLNKTPIWVQVGVISISALIWFFLPILRRYSSLVILVYCFSYLIYWRVFEKSFLRVKYKEKLFTYFLYASAMVMAVTSLVGDSCRRVVHIYNRWRLQKAFYYNKSVGNHGCSGISCYDCFPGCYLCLPKNKTSQKEEDAGPLSLGHLKNIKPKYISNVVVNGWRKRRERDEESQTKKYRLLAMFPDGLEEIDEVIDAQPTEQPSNATGKQSNAFEMQYITTNQTPDGFVANLPSPSQRPSNVFDSKLEPSDIKLSSAMAMSAAAVSPYSGKLEEWDPRLTHILSTLGLEMGTTIVYDIDGERKANRRTKGCLCIIKLVFFVLVLVFPALHLFDYIQDEEWLLISLTGPFVIPVLFSFLGCCINTGEENTEKRCSSIVRWLIVHVPLYRFAHSIFKIIHTGSVPPPMLHLSDGGHFENLGILPLLKLRLKKIMVVHGGYIGSKSCYGNDLVHALQLAREILGCSFTAKNGGDVLTDIKKKFVKSQNLPRKYEFKVQYPGQNGGEEGSVKEGDIVLLAPRKRESKESDLNDPDEEWKEDENWKDDPNAKLMFCCCNSCNNGCVCCSCCKPISDMLIQCCCCCNSYSHFCEWISDKLCGTFPHHSTGNQFFTPKMFAAYHNEGYRMCKEADNFFSETQQEGGGTSGETQISGGGGEEETDRVETQEPGKGERRNDKQKQPQQQKEEKRKEERTVKKEKKKQEERGARQESLTCKVDSFS